MDERTVDAAAVDASQATNAAGRPPRRRKWVAILGLVGLVGGAIAGWTARDPLYRAEAIVYVTPHPQNPAGYNDPAVFEGMIALRVQMMESLRVAKRATESQVWREAGGDSTPEAAQRFLERRSLVHRAPTLHTQIRFVDERPERALAGVQALTEAFVALSSRPVAMEKAGSDDVGKFAVQQVELLTARARHAAARVLDLTGPYGGEDGLAMRHRATLEQLFATEKELTSVRDGRGAGLRPFIPRTLGQIALESPQLADVQVQLEVLQADEKRLAATMGPKNEQLVALQAQIAAKERWIAQFVRDWNRRLEEEWDRKMQVTALPGSTPSDSEQAVAALERRIAALRAETQRLGEVRADVSDLKSAHDELERQIQQLQAFRDGFGAGGIQWDVARVADAGVLPTSPFEDRRAQLAGLGGFLGALLGAMAAALLGRRSRISA